MRARRKELADERTIAERDLDDLIDYTLGQLDKGKRSMSYENSEVIAEIKSHMEAAQSRYANFASTHEALGVIFEEFDELTEAIRANRIEAVREEAIDLAAVLIRLAEQCRSSENLKRRSVK